MTLIQCYEKSSAQMFLYVSGSTKSTLKNPSKTSDQARGMPATTRGPKLHCPRAQQLLRTIPARVPFSTSLTMAPVKQCQFYLPNGFCTFRKISRNFCELIDYGLVRNSHLCLISAMSWKNVKISGCVPSKSCKSNGLHQKGSLHPLQRNSITSLEFEMIHHYRLIHLPCMAG